MPYRVLQGNIPEHALNPGLPYDIALLGIYIEDISQ
jgi:hypothetical protein